MAGTIVVGADGSEASAEALRWAAAEARLRDARLLAVRAWSFVAPAPIGDPGMLAIPSSDLPGTLDAEANAARADLEASVQEALAGVPPVDVELRLVEGGAGEVLVSESETADLVVVGSHGRSGLRAALLGSVSRHVVDHALCPVVVVRPLS